MKSGNYDYPKDVRETLKINKKIRDEFNEFCKSKGIIKSKLIEKFYKTILIRHHDGSLNASKAHLSIDILTGTVRKGQ